MLIYLLIGSGIFATGDHLLNVVDAEQQALFNSEMELQGYNWTEKNISTFETSSGWTTMATKQCSSGITEACDFLSITDTVEDEYSLFLNIKMAAMALFIVLALIWMIIGFPVVSISVLCIYAEYIIDNP